MEGNGDHTHYVKRVVLPSGKTIEVVYFSESEPVIAEPNSAEELGAEASVDACPALQGTPLEDPFGDVVEPEGVALADAPVDYPPAEPHQELHVCLECASELVYPVSWEESGPENWSVLLHCPNCELYRDGIFSQQTVEVFDEELDRGSDALSRDYKRLMRANMAAEIDRFVGALDAGAILPEDF